MKRIYISKQYSKDFIINAVIPTYKKLLLSKLISRETENIMKYIKHTLQLPTIVNSILSNIQLYSDRDYYIVDIKRTVVLKKYKLEDICNLINDGNREFKGSKVFDSACEYIDNNIKTLYRIYIFRSKKRPEKEVN